MGATFKIPKIATPAVLSVLVAQYNLLRETLVSTNIHASSTPAGDVDDLGNPSGTVLEVTSPDADSEASAVLLTNELWNVVNQHFADTLAHKSAVSAAVATAVATNTATAITRANAIKAAYGTHRTAANVHFNNDATNTVTAADATDAASLYTLINELKDDVTAHIAASLAGGHIDLV